MISSPSHRVGRREARRGVDPPRRHQEARFRRSARRSCDAGVTAGHGAMTWAGGPQPMGDWPRCVSPGFRSPITVSHWRCLRGCADVDRGAGCRWTGASIATDCSAAAAAAAAAKKDAQNAKDAANNADTALRSRGRLSGCERCIWRRSIRDQCLEGDDCHRYGDVTNGQCGTSADRGHLSAYLRQSYENGGSQAMIAYIISANTIAAAIQRDVQVNEISSASQQLVARIAARGAEGDSTLAQDDAALAQVAAEEAQARTEQAIIKVQTQTLLQADITAHAQVSQAQNHFPRRWQRSPPRVRETRSIRPFRGRCSLLTPT